MEYRESVLVVILGNSGSGKSTVARELRAWHGRGCALVEQDYLRRILRERDKSGGLAPGLVEQTTRLALNAGYHVILEGIVATARYGAMLTGLAADYPGRSFSFYLDVSWEETVRRHRGRPEASEFTDENMADWYLARDIVGVAQEHVIAESSAIEDTIQFIVATSGLPQDGVTADFLPLPIAQQP